MKRDAKCRRCPGTRTAPTKTHHFSIKNPEKSHNIYNCISSVNSVFFLNYVEIVAFYSIFCFFISEPVSQVPHVLRPRSKKRTGRCAGRGNKAAVVAAVAGLGEGGGAACVWGNYAAYEASRHASHGAAAGPGRVASPHPHRCDTTRAGKGDRVAGRAKVPLRVDAARRAAVHTSSRAPTPPQRDLLGWLKRCRAAGCCCSRGPARLHGAGRAGRGLVDASTPHFSDGGGGGRLKAKPAARGLARRRPAAHGVPQRKNDGGPCDPGFPSPRWRAGARRGTGERGGGRRCKVPTPCLGRTQRGGSGRPSPSVGPR